MSDEVSDHLPHYRVRPRFKVETDYSIEDLVIKLNNSLGEDDATCKGSVNPKFISLRLPAKELHYWSPQLRINLEPTEKGCLLRGLYGPRPAVWTMFVFFYSLIGFITFLVLVIGLSKYSLNGSAPVLWFVPVLILMILSLYLVAYLGQKAGHDQMVTLHRFLEESTGLNIEEDQVSELE